MTGLVGWVQHRPSPPNPNAVASMADRLPAPRATTTARDDVLVDGPAALAHHADAHVDDELIIVLDGHIYDADPSPAEPGIPSSDAAAVASLWRRHGVDLVQHLDGAFALAVWERKPQVLHLIRDREGRRPLFWARNLRSLAFATHLPALFPARFVRRELNRDALAEYLSFGHVHAPRTLLSDVEAIPPGYRLRFGGTTVRLVRYHAPIYAAPDTPAPREADILPELNAALQQAVRRHLRHDPDAGVYLSGGVGSTSIIAAARAASRVLRTFTVSIADEPYPEFPFAGRVARLLGMEHATLNVGSKQIADAFDDAVSALGQPLANPAVVLQHLLAREASASVRTVLTGDGADELFGGRTLLRPARAIQRSARYHQLPSLLRTALNPLIGRSRRLRDIRIPPHTWPETQGVELGELMHARDRRRILLDELIVHPDVRSEVLDPYLSEVDTDPINRVLHASYRSHLQHDVLPRVDRTAAAHGLRVAYPLLDPEVRRLAQVLPGAFKVHGVSGPLPTRWLLRALLRTSLPAALVDRPDRSIPRPLEGWLCGTGLLFMEERFALLKRDPLDLWHINGLEALKRDLTRNPGAATRLWSLFILDAWLREHRIA